MIDYISSERKITSQLQKQMELKPKVDIAYFCSLWPGCDGMVGISPPLVYPLLNYFYPQWGQNLFPPTQSIFTITS